MDRSGNATLPDGGRPDAAEVLEGLGVEAGTALVQVGCDDGSFALAAAELLAPAPVYAVDVDGTLLDELEVRAIERGVENVTTVSGDARFLSELLPERVDAVLVADAFHGVESEGTFAEQVSRSLRPGGRLLVVDRRDPPREETAGGESRGSPEEVRTTPEETRLAVEPAGFELVREVDLPPDHYGLVFERAHDR